MCVYMYICVYTHIYVLTHIYTYILVLTRMRYDICRYEYNMYMHMCESIWICVYKYTCAHIHFDDQINFAFIYKEKKGKS